MMALSKRAIAEDKEAPSPSTPSGMIPVYEKGATVQAVFMSVYRTLKRRGLNPIETIVAAMKQYVRTGVLPPLPAESAIR